MFSKYKNKKYRHVHEEHRKQNTKQMENTDKFEGNDDYEIEDKFCRTFEDLASDNESDCDLDISVGHAQAVHEAYQASNKHHADENNTDVPIAFNQKIALWAVDNNISQTAVTNLLKILYSEGLNVPKSAITLLKIDSHFVIKDCGNGKLLIFSLRRSLQSRLQEELSDHRIISERYSELLQSCRKNRTLVTLNLYIDGMPISKSGNDQFWPILCKINESINKYPFVYGIFLGVSKSSNTSFCSRLYY